jgi:putative membrane protein
MMSLLFAAEEASSFFPETFWFQAVGAVVFGLIGIVLLLLGYWLFDRITPRIDFQKELSEKNVALGVVIAGLLLGIAYIMASVVK